MKEVAKPTRLFKYAAKSLSVVSDSVRPHRWQPTRLPRPWDSPGKNTGVGCRFLLQCMKVKSESEVAQLCATLSDHMDCSLPGSSVHGIFQARVLEWGAIAFSNGLKQIPYDYTVEVRNRFKGLDLIDRVPDELWMEVHDTVQEMGSRPPQEKEKQNGCLRRLYKYL